MDGRFTQAGGCFLAIAIIVGTVAGIAAGAPTIGILAGTAIGAALALLPWLAGRRR